MRVAQIAFKYGLRGTGGAAIASTRLHQAFLANGVESHYICVHQCEDGENVHVLPRQGTWLRRVYFVLTKVLRCMWHFTPYRKSIVMNVIPLYGLEKLLDEIKPDVVHIHWIIADVMAFEQIPKIKYPLVMHLHDLFNVNIYQPYPDRDKRFIEGVASENSTRLERCLFNRKRKAVCSAHPVFVGPSMWICNIGASSIIGKGLRFETVPNIIDSTFSYDGSCRGTGKKFVILFGAYGGRANPIKGWGDLMDSVRLLPTEVKANLEIRVFGESATDEIQDGVAVKFLGNIANPRDLRQAYLEADAFALPSREDNAPSTKFEALLCGLPVVAFNRTGCAEWIHHEQNGWVAADGSFVDYANGIRYFYDKFTKGEMGLLHEAIAKDAAENFQSKSVVRAMLKVYEAAC